MGNIFIVGFGLLGIDVTLLWKLSNLEHLGLRKCFDTRGFLFITLLTSIETRLGPQFCPD